MYFQIALLGKLLVTMFTRKLDTFMCGLDMSFHATLLCSFIVALITNIFPMQGELILIAHSDKIEQLINNQLNSVEFQHK